MSEGHCEKGRMNRIADLVIGFGVSVVLVLQNRCFECSHGALKVLLKVQRESRVALVDISKALERSSSASSCDTVKRVTCTYSLLLLLPTPTRRDACYQYRRAVITKTFIFVFSTPRSHALRLSVHNPTAALNEPPTSRLATLRIHDLRSTRNHLNIDYNVIARTLRERLKATLRTNP